MARARIQGVSRGHACKRCSGDEWRQYDKANGKKVWYCMPCNRSSQNRLRSDPAWTLWDSARHRARQQKLTFTITVDDVRAAFPANGRCAISGDRLVFQRGVARGDSPTLDRKDAARGFESGNLIVLSVQEAATRRHHARVAQGAA